jgi:hypothetical protein
MIKKTKPSHFERVKFHFEKDSGKGWKSEKLEAQ